MCWLRLLTYSESRWILGFISQSDRDARSVSYLHSTVINVKGEQFAGIAAEK